MSKRKMSDEEETVAIYCGGCFSNDDICLNVAKSIIGKYECLKSVIEKDEDEGSILIPDLEEDSLYPFVQFLTCPDHKFATHMLGLMVKVSVSIQFKDLWESASKQIDEAISALSESKEMRWPRMPLLCVLTSVQEGESHASEDRDVRDFVFENRISQKFQSWICQLLGQIDLDHDAFGRIIDALEKQDKAHLTWRLTGTK